MGIGWTCDGCITACAEADLTAHGTLATVYYCVGCVASYQAYRAAVEAARLEAVKTFEARREAARADAHRHLAKLPDE